MRPRAEKAVQSWHWNMRESKIEPFIAARRGDHWSPGGRVLGFRIDKHSVLQGRPMTAPCPGNYCQDYCLPVNEAEKKLAEDTMRKIGEI